MWGNLDSCSDKDTSYYVNGTNYSSFSQTQCLGKAQNKLAKLFEARNSLMRLLFQPRLKLEFWVKATIMTAEDRQVIRNRIIVSDIINIFKILIC